MKGVKFIYSSHAINRFNSRFPNHDIRTEEKSVQHCSTDELKSLKSSNSYKRAKRQNPRDLRFFRSNCGAYFVCRVEQIKDEIEYTKVITIIRNSKQESADHMQQMILEMYDRRKEKEKYEEKQSKENKRKNKSNTTESNSNAAVDSGAKDKCSPSHLQKSMKKGVLKSTILEMGRDSELSVFNKKSSAYVKNLNKNIKIIEDDQNLLNLNYLISRNMIQGRRFLLKANGEYLKSLDLPNKYKSNEDAFYGMLNESMELNKRNPLFFRVLWKQMFKTILNSEQWLNRKSNINNNNSEHPINKMNSHIRTLNSLKNVNGNFTIDQIEKTESLLVFETEVMTNIYSSGIAKQEDVFSILDRLYLLEPIAKKAGLSSRLDAILNFYNILEKQMFDTSKKEISLHTSNL